MKKLAGLRPHGGDCRQVRRVEMKRKPKRHTMTEYPEDYPTLSAGPPPVMYSDHVYDYPSSEHHDSVPPIVANHCGRDRGLRRRDCRGDSGHGGAHLPDPHVLGTSDGHLYRDTGSTLDCHFGEHGDFTRTCTSTGAPRHGDRASTAAGSSAAADPRVHLPAAAAESGQRRLLGRLLGGDGPVDSAAEFQAARTCRRRHHLGLQLDPGRTPSAQGALRREAVVVGGLAAHLRPRRLLGHRRGIHLRHRRGGQAVVPGPRS
jgi:hypothetical protein